MFATAARFAVKSLFIFKSIRIKSVINLLAPSSFRAAESVAARFLACLLITALLSTATILPWSKVQAAEAEKALSLPSAGIGNSLKSGGNLAVPEAFSFPAPSTSGNNSGTIGETFSLKSVATNLAAGITNPLNRMFGLSESGSSAAPDSTTEGAETVSADTPISPAPAGINPASRKISALPANSAPAMSAAETTTSAKAVSPASGISSAPAAAPRFTTKLTTFDFNGDNKHDYAVWRPSDGWWHVLMSQGNGLPPVLEKKHWGQSGDKPVPADYDADGKTDYAVYRPSASASPWLILRSSDNTLASPQLGVSDDLPIPADYDGDGKADPAIFRPSTGAWYILYSTTNQMGGVQWGANGDVPVPGNYDGSGIVDGKTDIAVWRPSTGYFYIYTSGGSYIYYPWGVSTDIPVPGDYDGDTKTDYGVWRPSTGYWYIIQSSNGAMLAAQMGSQHSDYQDVPVPADYDGDGKDDIAVWRAVNGTTYYMKSNFNNALALQPHGSYGDMPAPSSYIKRTPSSPATAASIPALSSARLSPKNETGGTNLYSRNFSWGTGLVSLPGRAGMDLGLGLSYNSLVWTKVDGESKIVFDADKSNITPGFRFGFPVIEPVYQDPVTGQYRHLMLTPSGERVELLRTNYDPNLNAAIYDAVDSSYTQMKATGLNLPVDQQTPVLRTASGTVMKYAWSAGAFRCTEIEDRNGNKITVNHDSGGILRSVTDTLGRIVSINYDADLDPVSITQPWNGDPAHAWASFSYTTVQVNYNFGSLGVTGLANNSSLKVLDRVTFADGSSYKFNYNIYGQVTRVSQYAADNPTTHRLNYVNVTLANYAGDALTDCPRFSETQTWAENFNNGNEVITKNTIQENKSFTVPGTSTTENGALITVTEASGTTEDVITESYVHPSGSKEGLSFATETCESAYSTNDACTATNRKRWTWTKWDLDTAGVNPRITETKVGDSGNTKRTEITYHPSYGLVNEVKEYDSNQTTPTVLRKTATDYELSADYISSARRIIGLPSEKRLYEGGTLVSRVGFTYDGTTVEDSGPNTTQHDTSYGTSFVKGRGNLTGVTRYRTGTTDTISLASIVVSTTKYNKTGSVVSSTDAEGRTTKVSYNDKFVNNQYADEASRNTFAYPTIFITPGASAGTEVSSTIKYRYDFGAQMEAQSPTPVAQVQLVTRRNYYADGRLERVTTTNNGAYTRYEYPTTQNEIRTFSTIISGQGETKSETLFDGHGRTRRGRTELPGSTSNWSGQRTEYDLLGRVSQQSVPTEVDSTWTPAGADATRGWLWTSYNYDWKGRVIKTINADGTFKTAEYDGCGCAGGEVVTIKGEEIKETDWQGNVTATLGKRTQKIYSDILGRQYKTKILNWDGNENTPYSTVVQTLNARDQVTNTKYYAGTDSATNNTVQETTFGYDGHGRLQTRHLPQQAFGRNTAYEYYLDDQVKKMTDARGAVTNFEYEGRGLLKTVSYAAPTNNEGLTPWLYRVDRVNGGNTLVVLGENFATNVEVVASTWTNSGTVQELARYSGAQLTRGTQENRETIAFQITQQNVIDALNQYNLRLQIINSDTKQQSYDVPLNVNSSQTPGFGWGSPEIVAPAGSVNYQYDNLGNITSMQDELGTLTYQYDQLSRVSSETRYITALNQSYQTSYGYELSGQLKTVTDPFNATISYTFNKSGGLTAVNGTNYGISTPFISNIEYRAWGGIKKADYGYGAQLNMTYDERLRPKRYEVAETVNGQVETRGSDYKYYADGQLKTASNLADNVFDKSYKYDQAGRLKEALSGFEARGEPLAPNTHPNRPYKQTYQYDVWGSRTGGENHLWRTDLGFAERTIVNNRVKGEQYDADGRALTSTYNAAGQAFENISAEYVSGDTISQPMYEIRQTYDGNGGIGKRMEVRRNEQMVGGQTTIVTTNTTTYFLRSTVLGGKEIAEINETGAKTEGFVYANGGLLAKHKGFCQGCTPYVEWQEANPLTGSRLEISNNGTRNLQERDPLGLNTGTFDPWSLVINPDYFDLLKPGDLQQNVFLDTGGDILNWQCEKDGMPYDCNSLENDIRAGSVVAQATDNRGRVTPISLDEGSLIRVGNTISIRLPDYYTTDWKYVDGVGWGEVLNIHSGEVYFIEVGVQQQKCPYCLPKVENNKDPQFRDGSRSGIDYEGRFRKELVATALGLLDANEKCEKLFNETLKKLEMQTGVKPAADNIRSLLESFLINGRIIIDQYGSSQALYGNPTEVKIATNYRFDDGRLQAYPPQHLAVTLLHELIHIAGKKSGVYSDTEVAKAMYEMGITVSTEEYSARSKQESYAASAISGIGQEAVCLGYYTTTPYLQYNRGIQHTGR